MNKQMCGEIAYNNLRVIQKLYNETKMSVSLVQDEGKLVALFYGDKFSLFLDIVDGVVTELMFLVNKIYQITMDDMGNGLYQMRKTITNHNHATSASVQINYADDTIDTIEVKIEGMDNEDVISGGI